MIVSYERVSTDTQENGLEVQSNEIKRYCDYKNITLGKSYVDFGVSGGRFDRDDFTEMIDDVKQNKISCIIIQELSRFGRNMFESLKYIEILKKHNCNLVVIKENIELAIRKIDRARRQKLFIIIFYLKKNPNSFF